MKTGALPKQLDLRVLAARGVEIAGILSSDDLPRLIEAGIQVVEPGSAAFQFRRDEAGRYVVEVQVRAEVAMQCQRCLSDMTLSLRPSAVMACIWTDEDASELPDTYEPLLVGETADLSEIAEEEILLALPVSPLHETECKSVEQTAALSVDEGAEASSEKDAERENPFAVLGQLKS